MFKAIVDCSNRTLLELKYLGELARLSGHGGSNRTLLELKLLGLLMGISEILVPIVPYWN